MARPVHPDKDIEAAVSYAEAKGWHYVPSSGHAWGRLFCPGGQRGDCKLSVWSTPRNAFAHARDIRRRVNADALLARFPNAQANDDERRRLRAALYRPLLCLDKEHRGRIVEAVLAILLDGGSDANA